MRTRPARHLTLAMRKSAGSVAALAAALMLGACAQGGGGPKLQALADDPLPQSSTGSQSDLKTATDYWGRKYAQSPRDLDAALSYAKNLKAMGRKREALEVLQQVAIFHGSDRNLASEYGRLALEFDRIGLAAKLLRAADDPANPDWKVLSARGTVLAKQGKYAESIPFYQRAMGLAPEQPSVMNNLALAYALTGEAGKAEPLLRRAVAMGGGGTPRTRQNLALVVGLQGKYDDAKRIAARDLGANDAAANASYLRRMVKLEPRPSGTTGTSSDVAVAQAPPLKPATYETTGAIGATGTWATEVAQRTGIR